MADGIFYKDAVVITRLKLDDGNVVLDLPFDIYSQTVMRLGEVLPTRIDPSLVGQEVLANVAYLVRHDKHPDWNDEPKVLAFSGYVEDYHTDPRVAVHQPVMEE